MNIFQFSLYVLTITCITLGFLKKKENQQVSNETKNLVHKTIEHVNISPKIEKTIQVQEEDTLWHLPPEAKLGKNWTFELFTSPTVVKVDGKFEAYYPWSKSIKADILPLRLKAVKRKPYPLQFAGYYQPPKNTTTTIILRVYDTNRIISTHVGESISDMHATIAQFHSHAQANKQYTYIHPEVHIHDTKENVDIHLGPGTAYYDHIWDVEMENTQTKHIFYLSRVGEQFTINDYDFLITGIHFDKQTVSISGKHKDQQESFDLELNIQKSTQSNQRTKKP